MNIKTNRTKAQFNILKSGVFAFLGLIVVFFTVHPALAQKKGSDEWHFSAGAYAWMPGMEVGTQTAGDIDLEFSDIFENLKFTSMISVGAQKRKWGFMTDIIYLNLENDDNVSLGPILTLSNVEIKAWILTPTVTYNVIHSDQWQLDLLAGARYLYLKGELTIDPLTKDSKSGDLWDGIIGVKGQFNLTPNWYLPFLFDVGTGDKTELTWQAFGGVGYKFSNFDLIVAYRHMTWDFDDSNPLSGEFTELTVSGPIFGIRFDF